MVDNAYEDLSVSYNDLLKAYNRSKISYEELLVKYENIFGKYLKLLDNSYKLIEDNTDLKLQCGKLSIEVSKVLEDHNLLRAQYVELQNGYNDYKQNNEHLRNENIKLIGELNEKISKR